MPHDLRHDVTEAIRKATGKVFCQYCRLDRAREDIAWMKPRACCTKCKTRGTRRGTSR